MCIRDSTNRIVASGDTSFAHFEQTTATGYIGAYGNYSAILGGNDHQINSDSTSAIIIGGQNNFINTNGIQSAIIGGRDNVINSGVTRSVILGGFGITGTTSDTTYVDNLNANGSVVILSNLPTFDSDALAGSLTTNQLYKTSTGELRIKL